MQTSIVLIFLPISLVLWQVFKLNIPRNRIISPDFFIFKKEIIFTNFLMSFFSDRQMRASTLVFEPTKLDLLMLKLGSPFWSELKLFNLQWIPK